VKPREWILNRSYEYILQQTIKELGAMLIGDGIVCRGTLVVRKSPRVFIAHSEGRTFSGSVFHVASQIAEWALEP
jgi:hypothetical protein